MGNGRLCVIVPAMNEAVVIGDTLASLIEANVHPYDIYVIDDGSSDHTGHIARITGVQVLRNEKNIGKASSVERLVAHYSLTERYEFIALMDADTRVNSEYFAAVKESFLDKEVVVVCGQPKSRPHNWLTAYRCFSYFLAAVVYRKGQSNMGVINVAPGCTTSYRSSIFGRLEWCDDTIVEDMDVTVQVHRKKLGRIVYQPKAIVYTQDPSTIRDYIKQINRWNVGAWQVVQKYHMVKNGKKIDWEYKLLMGEGLLFGMLYLLLPFLAFFFPTLLLGVAVDYAITFALSVGAGISGRRWDVVLCSPLYPLIRYCDCFMYWRSYWNTIIRGHHVSQWNPVKRYA